MLTYAGVVCAGAGGVKVQISAVPSAASDGVKRSAPPWLRSGGGTVSIVPSAAGLGSFASAPSSATTAAAAPISSSAAAAQPGGTGGGAALTAKLRESASGSSPGSSVAGGGTRGQIKFSMKSSNKLHALRGTPAGRSSAAAAKTHPAAAEGRKEQPSGVEGDKAPDNADDRKQAQTQPQPQQAAAAPTLQVPAAEEAMRTTEAAPAATAPTVNGGSKSSPPAAPPAATEESLRIYISRLGRDFSLEEAVEYQLEMSIEEHEVSPSCVLPWLFACLESLKSSSPSFVQMFLQSLNGKSLVLRVFPIAEIHGASVDVPG